MIKKHFEYLVVGCGEYLKDIRACEFVTSVVVTQISENIFHILVNASANTSNIGSLMQQFKSFDAKWCETKDTSVTLAQIKNFGLDDSNPNKKFGKEWSIPKDSFANKSEYLITNIS